MMHLRVFSSATAVLVFAITTIIPLAAKQPPPFGESITWNTDKESPSLAAMRGKSVLVLFFQDWCGICNRWSPDMFRQIGDAYGDDPSVVLVAIKTDGGSTGDAIDYLSSRTDTNKWLIGTDENASYYRQTTGDDKLYYYMWVKPDGSIGRIENSGVYLKNSNPKKFVLASKNLQKEFRKGTKTLIPADPALDPALQPAIDLAERGLFLGALAEAAKHDSDASLKEDVATLRQHIAKSLESSVEEHAGTVDDEGNANRYQAYLALQQISDAYGKSAPAEAARKTLAKHASSSWIEEEEEAADDYRSIMRRAARADDERSRNRITKALKKLAEEYPETYYGRLAASSAK